MTFYRVIWLPDSPHEAESVDNRLSIARASLFTSMTEAMIHAFDVQARFNLYCPFNILPLKR